MASTVNPITGAPTTGTTATKSATGLSSNDFMNLMITQLQHQDPMNPTDSNQLLQQIAQISTLQSNQGLQTSLSSLTLQQSIGAGGNLIGKSVQGIDSTGTHVNGNVTGVLVQNQQVLLQLDNGSSLPMANITAITAPVTATTTPAAATAATTTN